MSQSHSRIIPLQIADLTGSAVLDLFSQGISSSAVVLPVVERADATAHVIRQSLTSVKIQVLTHGRTIAPLPWDGFTEPLTVKALATWTVSDDTYLASRTYALDGALSHVIEHGMGTRNMVESIRSRGEAIFAGVTVLDMNRIQIDLTEIAPITVSIVFMYDVENPKGVQYVTEEDVDAKLVEVMDGMAQTFGEYEGPRLTQPTSGM